MVPRTLVIAVGANERVTVNLDMTAAIELASVDPRGFYTMEVGEGDRRYWCMDCEVIRFDRFNLILHMAAGLVVPL